MVAHAMTSDWTSMLDATILKMNEADPAMVLAVMTFSNSGSMLIVMDLSTVVA